jgi:ribosomal protein L7/L12
MSKQITIDMILQAIKDNRINGEKLLKNLSVSDPDGFIYSSIDVMLNHPVIDQPVITKSQHTALYSVRLNTIGSHKIEAIRFIREHTGAGLADSKWRAEHLPMVVKGNISFFEADKFASEYSRVTDGGSATILRQEE